MGLDIGENAIEQFTNVIKRSKTILWNGPMGVFEMERFRRGTKAVAHAVAEATKHGAYSLVGGGDSVAAINMFGLADEVSYVSTGGGAMLEYLEGKELPGIAAINKVS
jgi:phosphoglycerate kinase